MGTPRPSQESLSPPGAHLLRLSPWLRGMLGGLPGSLSPQLHKRLGLTVPLPALQQPQDWVPCEERCWGLGLEGVGGRQCLVVQGTAGNCYLLL